MSRTRAMCMAILAAGVATVVLAACGTASSVRGGDRSGGSAHSAGAEAPPPDVRACAGAEAIMGHIAAETAGWAPTQRPFDKDVQGRIALRAGQLAQQASQARTASVRQGVHETAVAFETVAHAMTSRSRRAVTQSIQRLQKSYRQLKVLCSWDS